MKSETGFDTGQYDRFPTSGPRPDGELEQLEEVWCGPRKPWEWITAINNNYIGVYYVGAAMMFFVLAGILAVLMRTQLAMPMTGFLPQETYNQFFTVHGTTMMFLFAVPAVEALGVLLLPQMLGARDLPFPRLSAYAFWAYLVGGLFFFSSIFFGLAPNGGWFMYPPLTSMAPAMAEISMKPMPSRQKSALIPGDPVVEVSGGYMNQPPFGATPKKIEEKKNRPPIR